MKSVDIDIWKLSEELTTVEAKLAFIESIKIKMLSFIKKAVRKKSTDHLYNILISKDYTYEFYTPANSDGTAAYNIIGDLVSEYKCFAAINFSKIVVYNLIAPPTPAEKMNTIEAIQVFTRIYDDSVRKDAGKYIVEHYEIINIMGVFDLSDFEGLQEVNNIALPEDFLLGFDSTGD